jgi:hypothetical protein
MFSSQSMTAECSPHAPQCVWFAASRGAPP